MFLRGSSVGGIGVLEFVCVCVYFVFAMLLVQLWTILEHCRSSRALLGLRVLSDASVVTAGLHGSHVVREDPSTETCDLPSKTISPCSPCSILALSPGIQGRNPVWL